MMLNINLECSRAYAQHFQFLSFHFHQSFMLNKKNSLLMFSRADAQHKHQILMCFRARTQHNHQITHVFQSSCSTQKSNHSCAPGSTPNTCNHIYAKIKHIHWLAPNISKNSSQSCVVGSYSQYTKYKHQINITCDGIHSHKCQVKIWDIIGKHIIINHIISFKTPIMDIILLPLHFTVKYPTSLAQKSLLMCI